MSATKLDLSIVLPVYRCADCIDEIYKQISNTYDPIGIRFEVIFVNDGSPDNAWSVISQLTSRTSRVVGINLSRNFGQHIAILAGLDRAQGQRVLVMDCDLEDSPAESLKLYRRLDDGFDIAWGVRKNRTHSVFKQLGSRIFYFFFNLISDFKRDAQIGNFVCINQVVLQSIRELREQTRFVPALLDWVGFKSDKIEVGHQERFAGKSSYDFGKLLMLAIDALVSHSLRPLYLILQFGLMISVLSFCYSGYILIEYFLNGISVSGWTTLSIAVMFSMGITTVLLGLIGIYVGKIYQEVKRRPLYLIKEVVQSHSHASKLAS